MDWYRHICILILIVPVFSRTFQYKMDIFNMFGFAYEVVGGISNTVGLLNSLKNVFVVLGESDTNGSSIPQIQHEDVFLNITELAEKYQYSIEVHTVTTEDGYILSLHRIPKGRNSTRNDLVVLLMHGILDSSDSWILQGPNKSLGYILAETGFDVWMGNARGNKHSQLHRKLKSSEPEFWAFTWDEIGQFDIPSMIDYILETTRMKTLYYIGHSQGTTSFYVMLSLKPDYNNKVKMMFSLAPVAWMSHVKSPIVKMFSPANKILQYINTNAYSGSTKYFNTVTNIICNFLPIRCDSLLNLIIGYDFKHINVSMLSIILGHMPSGSSTLQFVHFGQLVQSGRFCRYDRGNMKNLKVYGTKLPPDYDLSKISVPIVLYYSGNDWLSDPRDVEILENHLKVQTGNYIEDFNHLDYLFADTAKELIYLSIIKQIYYYETQISVSLESVKCP
ncbi:PREDICTED: lipase 3-like [Papilio polytes]|uniref:lipase 3-like n=1 Tax=Papilio polytes TaxID=76194 RepID=UPI000675BFCC|nr:PREDICTED: lipase 3-like [Papilio polytes]